MQRLAIVGGGAAGTAVVCELLRQSARANAKRSLTWFVGPTFRDDLRAIGALMRGTLWE